MEDKAFGDAVKNACFMRGKCDLDELVAKATKAIEVAKTTGQIHAALEAEGFNNYELTDLILAIPVEVRDEIYAVEDRKKMEGVKRAEDMRTKHHEAIKMALETGFPVYEVARDDVEDINYDSCLLEKEKAQKLVDEQNANNVMYPHRWGSFRAPRFYVRIHKME